MANSVAIPQDIIDNVIAAVNDKALLKQCALVSSSFLLPSRKQLFSEIPLKYARSVQGLHRFLVQNPVIQSFVRSIIIQWDYWGSGPFGTSESLPAILRLPFCCLQSFSIISYLPPCDWNSFSSELKDALFNIIHSSTLKTLCFDRVVNVPITLFLGVFHLTKLDMRFLSPHDFEGEQPSSLTPAASKGVSTTAYHTVIDQCVWSLRGRTHSTRFPTSGCFLTNSGHRK